MSGIASSTQDVLDKYLDERLKYFRQKNVYWTPYFSHIGYGLWLNFIMKENKISDK